jgi:hypothetical protein
MSRNPRFSRVGTPAALGVLLFSLLSAACEEDGKTAPDECLEPRLEIYDIQGGAPAETKNPCVTPIGHAVNQSAATAGSSTGGTGGTATGAAGAP